MKNIKFSTTQVPLFFFLCCNSNFFLSAMLLYHKYNLILLNTVSVGKGEGLIISLFRVFQSLTPSSGYIATIIKHTFHK